MNDHARELLGLCTIRGLSWRLIAKEALRPEGFERLSRAHGHRSRWDGLASELSRASRIGATFVTILDDGYPVELRRAASPPPFLCLRGAPLVRDELSVAVVGSREATSGGVRLAASLAAGLAQEGATVVSGLARGIDTAAHRAVLDAGHRTIAVLGTGILRCYPKENAGLAAEIARSGTLVSPFWPSAPPTKRSFLRRNEVAAGMTSATFVVEAHERSGARMQARVARDEGKPVLLSAHVVREQSWASREAMMPGTVVVHGARDVIEALAGSHATPRREGPPGARDVIEALAGSQLCFEWG
jgi:DNA processing protein